MIAVTTTWHNAGPHTVWGKLAERLGREPTNGEARDEVLRILRDEPTQESLAKVTNGKTGMAVGTPHVRRSTAGTGLRVGEAVAVQPATSEVMDVTAGETAPNTAASSVKASARPVATEELVSCRDHYPRGYATVNDDQLGRGGNRPSRRLNRDEQPRMAVVVTAGETATISTKRFNHVAGPATAINQESGGGE